MLAINPSGQLAIEDKIIFALVVLLVLADRVNDSVTGKVQYIYQQITFYY